MDPIQFIEDPLLIADKSLSPAQKMVVKSIYCLRMNSEESELWAQAAGGRRYVAGVEQDEITILMSRKAGDDWNYLKKVANKKPDPITHLIENEKHSSQFKKGAKNGR